MDYYDILNILPNASRTDILHAYRIKLSLLGQKSKTSIQSYEQLTSVRQAFNILYQCDTRSNYDQRLRQSASKTNNPTNPSLIGQQDDSSAPYDVIGDIIETNKLPWRYLFTYPLTLIIKKIIAEIIVRVFLIIVGGIFGFIAIILFYMKSSYKDLHNFYDIPNPIIYIVITFAVIFFFGKEIYFLFFNSRNDS